MRGDGPRDSPPRRAARQPDSTAMLVDCVVMAANAILKRRAKISPTHAAERSDAVANAVPQERFETPRSNHSYGASSRNRFQLDTFNASSTGRSRPPYRLRPQRTSSHSGLAAFMNHSVGLDAGHETRYSRHMARPSTSMVSWWRTNTHAPPAATRITRIGASWTAVQQQTSEVERRENQK